MDMNNEQPKAWPLGWHIILTESKGECIKTTPLVAELDFSQHTMFVCRSHHGFPEEIDS